jgi:hypothetical protein
MTLSLWQATEPAKFVPKLRVRYLAHQWRAHLRNHSGLLSTDFPANSQQINSMKGSLGPRFYKARLLAIMVNYATRAATRTSLITIRHNNV